MIKMLLLASSTLESCFITKSSCNSYWNRHWLISINIYIYWSNVTFLNCRAHANIHIVVIRCLFNCCFECFHTADCCQFLLFISLLRGKRAIYIYIFIQTPLSSFRFIRQRLLRSISLELHPGGLKRYSATLVKPQYCRILH